MYFHAVLKSPKRHWPLTVFAVLSLLLVWQAPGAGNQEPVKNIIFFIGDGMGTTAVTLARYYSMHAHGRDLAMTRVMNSGSTAYMTTHSADYLGTDSAAAATALATGCKTNNAGISMTPEGIRLPTILEQARDKGKRVGVVTTSRLTHATPACFLAHADHRDRENSLAEAIIADPPTVFLGGGRRHFLPGRHEESKRSDDRNLLAEAAKQGYRQVRNTSELRGIDVETTEKLLGVFSSSHMSYELDRNPEREPDLAEMTEAAITVLERGPQGFFLMVEGARIDHAAHLNDAAGLVREMLAFDKAIAAALAYAVVEPNTLIVITADHATAGPLSKGRPTPHDALEYISPEDLGLLSKASASFDTITDKVEDSSNPADVESIVEKYTGIDITDEEAQEIASSEILSPALSREVYLITAETCAILKEHRVPADILDNLKKLEEEEFDDPVMFQEALQAAVGEAHGETYGPIIAQHARRLVKGDGVSMARAVADELSICWPTRHHAAEMVMLFAAGPYSERFTGLLDNTDVPKIMAAAFHLDE